MKKITLLLVAVFVMIAALQLTSCNKSNKDGAKSNKDGASSGTLLGTWRSINGTEIEYEAGVIVENDMWVDTGWVITFNANGLGQMNEDIVADPLNTVPFEWKTLGDSIYISGMQVRRYQLFDNKLILKWGGTFAGYGEIGIDSFIKQ
jgi:hypothetical protein